jgi:3-dehydroquinate synthase II
VKRLKKIVWIRADCNKEQKQRKKIVMSSLENNFIDIIIKEEDKETFKKLAKFNCIIPNEGKFQLNNKNGEFITIESKQDEERAADLAGKTDYVVVSASDWKVIPVENLIATFQKSNSKLLVEVSTEEEARLFFEALEVGVDGVVLVTQDFNKVHALKRMMEELEEKKLNLVSAKITDMKSLGLGDRVCIDSCSILSVGEGMLIGSQSNGMFLVHSESVEAEYADTRPFRVNAGPVHAYILCPNDRTKYLSDLKVGDEILAVNEKGNTRSVVLGRIKIEKRPLILMEVEYEGRKYNIILQNAETIRLMSDGVPKSIVDLDEGDSVLLWIDDQGRHFGTKVTESIIEK